MRQLAFFPLARDDGSDGGDRPRRRRKARRPETAAQKDVRLRLERALGTRVDLDDRGGRVTVTLTCGSYDELDALMRRVGAS